MANDPGTLQDTVLAELRDRGVPATLFLTNGVRMQGVVALFDRLTVLLFRDGQASLIYKHAIATAVPFDQLALGRVVETSGAATSDSSSARTRSGA